MKKFNAISVDDNEINLLLIESCADELNLNVTSFLNPVNALEYAFAKTPDVIFIDYIMPQMDGIEFVSVFRRENLETPIIMITAENDNSLKINALKAGVTDFLTNPFNTAEFVARVSNILKLHSLQKQVEKRSLLLEEKVELATRKILDREKETLMVLGKAAEYKDIDTELHTERVAKYSRLLAQNIGLPEKVQDIIFNSAQLHDIGKIGIPDHVLLKKGKFNDSEFSVMKQHTIIGFHILENTKSEYLEAGKSIALFHHERFDGSGYPYGMMGSDIPIIPRIVAVADVFDALLSKRTYKEPWSLQEAVSYMQAEKGRQFDPELVEAFLKDDKKLRLICNYNSSVNI